MMESFRPSPLKRSFGDAIGVTAISVAIIIVLCLPLISHIMLKRQARFALAVTRVTSFLYILSPFCIGFFIATIPMLGYIRVMRRSAVWVYGKALGQGRPKRSPVPDKSPATDGGSVPTGVLLCPDCRIRVVPKKDGTCPSCNLLIVEPSPQTAPTQVQAQTVGETKTIPKAVPSREDEIWKIVWNQVEPTRLGELDMDAITRLGTEAVPVITSIFKHPKEPVTGMACNQAVLAAALSIIYARSGDGAAGAFLRDIGGGRVDLHDAWGQAAYGIAKQFTSENPLETNSGKPSCATCGRSDVDLTQCMKCGNIFCADHGKRFAGMFACPDCLRGARQQWTSQVISEMRGEPEEPGDIIAEPGTGNRTHGGRGLSTNYIRDYLLTSVRERAICEGSMDEFRKGQGDFRDLGGAILGTLDWVASEVSARLKSLEALSVDAEKAVRYDWQKVDLSVFCLRIQALRANGTMAAGYLAHWQGDGFGAFGFGFSAGERKEA
jgi:hypothetical protein